MLKKTFPILVMMFLSLRLYAGLVYSETFDSPAALQGWKLPASQSFSLENGFNVVFKDKAPGNCFALKDLNVKELSGKIISFSCELEGKDIMASDSDKGINGAKIMLKLKSASSTKWQPLQVPYGSFSSRKLESVFAVSPELESAVLNIGFQNTSGSFKIKKLKIESVGSAVAFQKIANMGLSDELAGDGKGGWTDQGAAQDGKAFQKLLKSGNLAGIPIACAEGDKAVLVMKSPHSSYGANSAEVELSSADAESEWLYVLHTGAWLPEKSVRLGQIIVEGSEKSQTININTGIDVGEWFQKVFPLKNASPVLTKTDKDESVGLYVAKFPLERGLGELRKISFVSDESGVWLILGATLMSRNMPLQKLLPVEMKADGNWLPVSRSERNKIVPGSALDLSAFLPPRRKEGLEKLLINKDGHFAYVSKPDEPIRFLTAALSIHDMNVSHELLEALAEELYLNGYNMVRFHGIDTFLMQEASVEGVPNPDRADKMDYFISCLKQRGIYLNVDLMTSWIGYNIGNIYDKQNKDPLKSYKSRIHFENDVKNNWKKGVSFLLGHENKYTGTRLADDPVLAMCLGFNEQEYGFWLSFDKKMIEAPWQDFLRKRYGDIGKLKQSWGARADAYNSFSDIPCFDLKGRVYNDDDIAAFLSEKESETLKWFQQEASSVGYKGPVGAYNCGKTLYYSMIRRDSPFVAMNAYHAHPSDWVMANSVISQKSSIDDGAKLFRDLVSSRQKGKPFIVTEYNIAFWNKYRYEQSFVVGAYAALHSIDALTMLASPVSFRGGKILSFGNACDPIAKASEFLTFFLYIRGDVKAAEKSLRVRVEYDDVFRKGGIRGVLPADISLTAMILPSAVECLGPDAKASALALAKNEFLVRPQDSDDFMVSAAGFASSVDKERKDPIPLVKTLRDNGFISQSNKSDGIAIFESEGGEIYMDCRRKFMKIETPRFQGICAEAGIKSKLQDFNVESIGKSGNISLVSIDGMKPIYESSHMMLVYATNALNSGMKFTSSNMQTLVDIGKEPALLERGTFTVKIHNKKAGDLKLYPLDLTGNRLNTIKPAAVEGEWALFSVDTGKDGTSVFFELQ